MARELLFEQFAYWLEAPLDGCVSGNQQTLVQGGALNAVTLLHFKRSHPLNSFIVILFIFLAVPPFSPGQGATQVKFL
ncbi:hypothetical protein DNTS_015576 [Danionella cerebrum]|uniref:Uncharacterized protein n=1 Tax=Danionella cerebrum TaxID=2873325 RepID=A0A553R1P2_9TELE|nr:hypothetical protein DNTS_015576 [Danionella translucida]